MERYKLLCSVFPILHLIDLLLVLHCLGLVNIPQFVFPWMVIVLMQTVRWLSMLLDTILSRMA